jgi:putative Mg2+ transporter-C (MgtC) family protein
METLYFIKVLLAFIAGGCFGMEREYRSKPAGFRTMILICVGSCLFSILSKTFTENSDRIASNIVTGIGFIGAGVIFKEGVNVRGITSAATIWITAAIGMCIGFGLYPLAAFVVLLALITLIVLSRLEETLDGMHQVKMYLIRLKAYEYSIDNLEKDMIEIGIKFLRSKLAKENDEVIVEYKIISDQAKRELLNQSLINNKSVSGFEA